MISAPPSWRSPLPLLWMGSADGNSFENVKPGCSIIPLAPHPGAFGVVRKHHIHEGVDLYAPDGTPVSAVEDGVVVKIEWFTGPQAQSPWWLPTQAVFVEGASGVVVYGEIVPHPDIKEGMFVSAGTLLGKITPVLKKDKGRPQSMLHLELHLPGTRRAPEWPLHSDKPASLQDPTWMLMSLLVNHDTPSP